MHQRRAISIKRTLNALAPINAIPAEILGQVFQLCQTESEAWTSGPYGWITVTQVCHLWRQLAITCPPLWCDIHVIRSHWVGVCLSRSEDMPLVAHHIPLLPNDILRDQMGWGWHAVVLDNTDALLVLLNAISRIKDLSVSLYDSTLDKVSAAPWVDEPASLLEKLTLELKPVHESYSSGSGLLPIFLARDCPRLRILDLCDTFFMLNSRLYPPSLTSLRLSATFRLSDYNSFGGELLGVLQQLPLLQSLSLRDYDPINWMSVDASYRPVLQSGHRVNLPQLDFIQLSGLPFDILNKITPSPTIATVKLDCDISSLSMSEQFPFLWDFLASHLGSAYWSGSGRLLKRLAIKSIPEFPVYPSQFEPVLQVFGWGEGFPDNIMHEALAGENQPQFLLTINFFPTNDAFDGFSELVLGLCRQLSLGGLEWLDIEEAVGELWLDANTVLTSFQTNDTISRVGCVKWLAFHGFVEVLAKDPALNNGDAIAGTGEPVFPALKTLHLVECSLDTRDMNRLIRCLQKRNEMGYRISTIEIQPSDGFTPFSIEKFRQVVDHVVIKDV